MRRGAANDGALFSADEVPINNMLTYANA
jgi:hypothetical protein